MCMHEKLSAIGHQPSAQPSECSDSARKTTYGTLVADRLATALPAHLTRRSAEEIAVATRVQAERVEREPDGADHRHDDDDAAEHGEVAPRVGRPPVLRRGGGREEPEKGGASPGRLKAGFPLRRADG